MVESFERDWGDLIEPDKASRIYRSGLHKKDGDFSLCWEFEHDSKLSIHGDIEYASTAKDAKNKAVATFCVWIYCETVQEGVVEFLFYNSGRLCCQFEFHLGFTGWRTCWVPFSDMKGKPEVSMDELRIQAKTLAAGAIYLDQLISCAMIDPRHHTRDFQVPLVNMAADTGVNNHWLSLLRYWNFIGQHVGNETEGGAVDCEIDLVEERFQSYLKDRYEYAPLDEDTKKRLAMEAETYHLELTKAGIRGRTVNSGVHVDAFPAGNREELKRLTDAADMKDCAALMLLLARYSLGSSGEDREWLEQTFVLFTRHILDQGWDCRSSLGTAHHLGYPMFSLYHALYIMRQVLEREQLLWKVRDMIGWFSGAGRMFCPEAELDNESMDTLNTLLQGMVIWIFLDDREDRKHTCMQALSHWLSCCMKPSPGVSGPFKADGSAFHHCGHYPAYAVGGFDGVTPVVYCLSRTKYRVEPEAHQTLKNAVLAMRLYCDRSQWLVSMSARHPVGEGPLASIVSLVPFYYLALAGVPSGEPGVDREMGAAFLRLAEYLPGKQRFVEYIRDSGVKAEDEPQGTYPMNYACALIHRQDSWMAGVRGHSRYLWAHESYEANNLYGRYITYGNLQIPGNGYSANGWDWASWPGTTAVHLPLKRLRSDVCNVDCCSGFEEMLLSDEAFAGGMHMDHRYGMFAMKLHGHAKYDGSERARKSWFFFGSRIVCLGDGIENDNEDFETRTTLFQNMMRNREETCFVYPDTIRFGEEKHVSRGERVWVCDHVGNGYYVPAGQDLCLSYLCQESRIQNTGIESFGDFEKAWLDHGRNPKGASYEYAVCVESDEDKMIKFSGEMQEENPPYRVVECTGRAHILYDRDSGIYGYAFFEPGMEYRAGQLCATDTPLLAMEQYQDGVLKLNLCDPDLRFYEGIEPDQIDSEGRQREVSLYSRNWIYNSSIVKTVKVWLCGSFRLTKGDKSATVSWQDGNTVLEFSSHDGMTFEFELESGQN